MKKKCCQYIFIGIFLQWLPMVPMSFANEKDAPLEQSKESFRNPFVEREEIQKRALKSKETAPLQTPLSNGNDRGENIRIPKLELKQTKVKDALRIIVDLTGINAIATEEAGDKTVTLYLRDITARQAIDTIVKISDLWYKEEPEANTFHIMTTDEFQKDLVIHRRVVTRVFTLLHHNTVALARVVADLYGKRVILSLGEEDDAGTGFGAAGNTSRSGTGSSEGDGTGSGQVGQGTQQEQDSKLTLTSNQLAELMRRLKESPTEGKESGPSDILQGVVQQEPLIFVAVVRQHNAIVVRTASVAVIKDIELLIEQLDRPTPQVLLEMKIFRSGMGDGFRSIFDFDQTRGPVTSGPPTGQPPNIRIPSVSVGNQEILGVGNFPLEGGTLLYQFINDHIRGRIQLLAKENKLKTVATPVILASNNRPARLFVGEQRVLVTGVKSKVLSTATGLSTTIIEPVTEIRDIGHTLFIQPKINADRTVTLSINQDSSRVLVNSATIPVATGSGEIKAFPIDTVDTAILQGTVIAKDGLSVAVGGLIQDSISNDQQKVPFFGDIPLLGWFFRREVQDKSKSELILMITPHILTTPIEGQKVTDVLIDKRFENSDLKEKIMNP